MSFIYSKGALLFSYLPLIWIPRKYDSDSNNEVILTCVVGRVIEWKGEVAKIDIFSYFHQDITNIRDKGFEVRSKIQ